jgi:hypothetical protein
LSNEATGGAAQPSPANLAYDEMMGRVYYPTFFAKLASHGIHPRDEDEANLYLQMGGQLFQLHQQQVEKQAGQRSQFLQRAAAQLDQYMGPGSPHHVKVAAAQFAGDKNILTAAMVLSQVAAQAQV